MAIESEIDRVVAGKKGVTVVVSRTVFPGKEKEYEDWARRLVGAATESAGLVGVTMLVPEPGKSGLRHVVMYFQDEKTMHQWETSYTRQKLSHEADAFSRRVRQEATGLETWFSIPDCPQLEVPKPWKMAVVTFLAVFALSIGILRLLKWMFPGMNFYLEGFLVAFILVGLLTWIVMPFLSRHVFRGWLHR